MFVLPHRLPNVFDASVLGEAVAQIIFLSLKKVWL